MQIIRKDYYRHTMRPFFFFIKETADLNPPRAISIVGTRRNSEYGKQITEKLIQDLAPYDVMIISGLAFGIDAIAHKQALKQGLSTRLLYLHTDWLPFIRRNTVSFPSRSSNRVDLLTEYISRCESRQTSFSDS